MVREYLHIPAKSLKQIKNNKGPSIDHWGTRLLSDGTSINICMWDDFET